MTTLWRTIQFIKTFNSISLELTGNNWSPKSPPAARKEDENSKCHPTTTKRVFVKGEGLRILRTNSSKALFEEEILTTLKNV